MSARANGWRLAWSAIRLRPWRYGLTVVGFIGFYGAPLLVGLLLQGAFDAIVGDAPAGWDLSSLLGVLTAVEVARVLWLRGIMGVFERWWVLLQTHLRDNLLRAQVASGGPGAGRPVTSSGEGVGVFRDDVEDFMQFLDSLIDLAGTAAFAIGALALMARVDPLVTGVVAVPLLLALLANRALRGRIRANRRADRGAAVAVTGFVGELFSSVLALQTGGAQRAAVRRLERLNLHRARAAIRDRVTTDVLERFNVATVDLGTGLVLLAVSGAMRVGDFTVGDLALFTSYLVVLADLPRWVGIVAARRRQLEVAADRMAALLPGQRPEEVVVRRHLPLPPPATTGESLVAATRPADVRLAGVVYRHPGSGRGLDDVDLHLAPGALTVLTGPVGSGKTTLLRVLLGLADPEGLVAGTVRWDGEVVDDPAAHMVPPRAASVSQVPRLFSERLRDNVALGLDVDDDALRAVLAAVALEADLATMPDGVDTVLGARGTRLSGGQAQRVAAARALVRRPALLVLDDLSSALDVTTELQLWDHLLAERTATCLAVSHRPAVLARADQVVVLRDGRVTARGTPDELRKTGTLPGMVSALLG